MHPLLSDPWVAAQIDAAVAPYAGKLPPAQIAWMREQLAETLAGDPSAAGLLRSAKPRDVDQSGEVGEPAASLDEGERSQVVRPLRRQSAK